MGSTAACHTVTDTSQIRGSTWLWVPFAELYVLSAESTVVGYCDMRSGEPGSLVVKGGIGPGLLQLHLSPALPVFRYGEAANPGPSLLLDDDEPLFCSTTDASSRFRLGCANPSGLRQKELHAVELGPGIWGFSETQLTAYTQRTCFWRLRQLAHQADRHLRVHMGAPARTRANSEWAGSWSGVATISDFPSQPVHLPWLQEEFTSGRILTTRHLVHGMPFLNTTLYGFPKGPTYPQALSLTSRLLEVITREVVIGGQGPRAVIGDFNVGPADLEAFRVWERYGWRNAQCFAAQHFNWTPRPTSKNAQERDLIWLSPEALALFVGIQMSEDFADHHTLFVDLKVPEVGGPLRCWPRPAVIPWDSVDPAWGDADPPGLLPQDTATAQYKCFWHAFENSLNGHLKRHNQQSLSTAERGRASRTQPMRVPQVPSVPRPSREGEVVMRNDLLGMSVRQWFKQLRRLQALMQATLAGSDSISAVTYRLEVWSAILRAPGFQDGFAMWWQHHRIAGDHDAPQVLPTAPPSAEFIEPIFRSFKQNFDSFESWHLRKRGQSLQLKYDKTLRALYQDLQTPKRDGIDLLCHDKEYTILAVDETGCNVHLDAPVDTRGTSLWCVDEVPARLSQVNGDQCSIEIATPVGAEMVLCQRQYLSSVQEVHDELLCHWTQRWNNRTQPSEEEWGRISGFFRAYVPVMQFDLPPITPIQWKRALKRYKPTAARGVDGISHVDLTRLPDAWLEVLLDFIQQVEQGRHGWPQQLLYGVTACLAKADGACEVGSFRPVVIFGIVYRTWAAIRSRQLLRILAPQVPASACGFLAGREPAQYWLKLQATIEAAFQTDQVLSGASTDLRRAFNTIPREHSFHLAQHLGVPECVRWPWRRFLQECTRAFQIGSFLSEPLVSSCGMPEGDSLSVYAMVQLDFALHLYMQAFSPAPTRTLSFVDNFMLVAPDPGQLAQTWTCLMAFLELWHMEADSGKTYSWSLSGPHRDQLRLLGFQCVFNATELGGHMTFGGRRSIAHQESRLARLDAKWDRQRMLKS